MHSCENIPLQQSVVKTLLYFDIFRYPLKTEEVFKFLGANTITRIDVQETLELLVQKGFAFRHFDLYGLQEDDSLAKRRLAGNRKAADMMGLARRRARLIGRFPFVRGVMASGSFSKGYMDDTSDLDFFVVTAPDRLWIARTLIVLFKRVFFFNSHKYFCCNYFVDSNQLEIDEKNLFTATELATLIPLYGITHYINLLRSNAWVTRYFPNFKIPGSARDEKYIPGIKARIEFLLRGRAGEQMETFFMRLTLRRWKNLYGHEYAAQDFDLAFKTLRSVSKNHPKHFQRKILQRYREKVADFNQENSGILEVSI